MRMLDESIGTVVVMIMIIITLCELLYWCVGSYMLKQMFENGVKH